MEMRMMRIYKLKMDEILTFKQLFIEGTFQPKIFINLIRFLQT